MRHMAKPKRTARVEWLGGIYAPPDMRIKNAVEEFVPEMIAWMTPDGQPLSATFSEPGRGLADIVDNFWATTQTPAVGHAHVPTHLRVAAPELATYLQRELGPRVTVECGATPLLEEFAHGFAANMAKANARTDSYLTPGHTPALIAQYFASSAALFRAAPWTIVPGNGCILGVTLPAFGLTDAVISILGHRGETFGYMLFENHDDYVDYIDASASIGASRQLGSAVPKFWGQSYERGEDLHPGKKRDVVQHGWQLVNSRAFPEIMCCAPGRQNREPTPPETELITTINAALAELLTSEQRLGFAWEQGSARIHRTMGNLTWTVPHPAYQTPDEGDAELDEGDDIMDEFAQTTAGLSLGADLDWADLFVDCLGNGLGKSITELDPPALRTVLFTIFPAQVTCAPSDATAIITSVRALLTFLQTTKQLPKAKACLAALTPATTKRLEFELADDGNFGMAKSMAMAAAAAGFDTSTEAGLAAWLETIKRDGGGHGRGVGPSTSSGGHGARNDKRSAKEKNKRKAAKAARKKNR
jgi:hypothetical protein